MFASPSDLASFALKAEKTFRLMPFMNSYVIFLFTTRWKLLSVLSQSMCLCGGETRQTSKDDDEEDIQEFND